jgi:spore coat polysaccharide biosynthesis protein SpsF
LTKKLTAIIQTRFNSTRLPGKVLKPINNKTILEYVISQSLHSRNLDNVIVATTTNPKDKIIVDFCKNHNIDFFCGSEFDVLDRYFQCAKKFDLDPIIRITSDCPLIDPNVIDAIVDEFLNNTFDYVSNNIIFQDNKWIDSECNFPQGMTVEISSFKALELAWKNSKKPSEREHVFPYVQFHPEIFHVKNVQNDSNLSHVRCTIDREDDLKFLKEIIQRLPPNLPFVTIGDILKIIKDNPNLLKINNHIPFDEGIKKSYLEDKKIRHEKV